MRIIDAKDLKIEGAPFEHKVMKALGIKRSDAIATHIIPETIYNHANVTQEHMINEGFKDLLIKMYEAGYYCEYGSDIAVKHVILFSDFMHKGSSEDVTYLVMKGVKMRDE